jgi:hypothetical protein
VERIWTSLFSSAASRRLWHALLAIVFIWTAAPAFAADPETLEELRQLRQENRSLRERLDRQQQVIDSLASKVTTIEQKQQSTGEASGSDAARSGSLIQNITGPTRLNISGQVAAGLFHTGSKGMFPNSEFRLDEAHIFLDAKAWEDVYAFVEINAATREGGDDLFHLGEAYIDWERIVKWAGLDSLVNIRMGRFYTPYGEEYQVRYPMENPLVTHSLADFWGYDTGLEIYGSHSGFQYAIAVQNGGISATRDFTSDKLVAGRLGYQPAKWFRASVSGMRTGDLSAQNDSVSSMWFGNGFFRSLGNPATTMTYHADMGEADLEFLFPRGHVKLAGGGIHYDDDDRSADNCRDVYYYSAEGMFRFTKQFYAATRFSQIFCEQGFPVLGNGTWGEHFYGPLTDNIWRWSIGLGYMPYPNLVLKIEYAIERGTIVGGGDRNHEDFFGVQAALRF